MAVGGPRLAVVSIDVTDQTFEAEVMARSEATPVVVDLWAPWCGPCKTLGPILEAVVDASEGAVVLAKVNTDENPQVAASFQVQSIPAVYGVRDRKVVDGFVGARGQRDVEAFIERLVPSEEDEAVAALLEAGDEDSLRSALELRPDADAVVLALATLLAGSDRGDEALELLGRIPETAEVRRVAALARHGGDAAVDVGSRLDALLDQVKGHEAARQEFVDLLELLGPDDPRTAEYRKALTARLF